MTKVVLGPISAESDGQVRGLGVLMPILLGFIAPMILIVVLDPSILGYTRAVLMTLLFVAFCFAVVLFMYSVFAQKTLARVVLDPTAREAHLVHESLFAEDIEAIPFDRIRELRVRQQYDQDGYGALRAEILLRSGDTVVLPVGTTSAQCDQANSILNARP